MTCVNTSFIFRQSRSTERFTERMKLLEERQEQRDRDKRAHTPTGLKGKFSAAFSRFESPSDKNRSSSPGPTQTTKPDRTTPQRRMSSDSSKSSESEKVMKTQANLPISKPHQKEEHKVEKPVQPAYNKPTESKPIEPQKVAETKTSPTFNKPQLSRNDAVDKQHDLPRSKTEAAPEKKPEQHKTVEKTKSFDTAVPSRASPSGSKVLERMAKFGESVDQPTQTKEPRPEKTHQTVTTKKSASERFERFTHITTQTEFTNEENSKPHFDVDIHIGKEEPHTTQPHKETKASPKSPKSSSINVQQKEEYLNVWDTEIPVRDATEKVGLGWGAICPCVA